MRRRAAIAPLLALGACLAAASARGADTAAEVYDPENPTVRISEALPHLDVRHQGRSVRLMRHQDPGHTVDPPYDRTSRDCPPYCIQPMQVAPGIETIGELELIDHLRRREQGDDRVLVVDSRTPEWVAQGTIPGSVNIPYPRLDPSESSPREVAELLELEFGAARTGPLWDFSHAKTVVLFCNGPWCGQSPTNIRALLRLGYPAHKLKWYRGGLQAWESFGLTTVKAGPGN